LRSLQQQHTARRGGCDRSQFWDSTLRTA